LVFNYAAQRRGMVPFSTAVLLWLLTASGVLACHTLCYAFRLLQVRACITRYACARPHPPPRRAHVALGDTLPASPRRGMGCRHLSRCSNGQITAATTSGGLVDSHGTYINVCLAHYGARFTRLRFTAPHAFHYLACMDGGNHFRDNLARSPTPAAATGGAPPPIALAFASVSRHLACHGGGLVTLAASPRAAAASRWHCISAHAPTPIKLLAAFLGGSAHSSHPTTHHTLRLPACLTRKREKWNRTPSSSCL